jgi:hypothetical protein
MATAKAKKQIPPHSTALRVRNGNCKGNDEGNGDRSTAMPFFASLRRQAEDAPAHSVVEEVTVIESVVW